MARPSGVDHPNSRFTAAKVREIRRRYAKGGVSQAALAKEHGVTQRTISLIVRGFSYKAAAR